MKEIYQEDCVEGMRERLEESSVDVIVTSPPYNIGVDYHTHRDDMPFEDYLDWMETVASSCRRVLKEGGSFFFNIGDRPSDELRSLRVAKRIRKHFCLQNTIHWVKSIAVPEKEINIGHYKPVNSERYLNNCHEYIFHFTSNGDVRLAKLSIGVPYADKSNIGRWEHARQDLRDRGNMWFIPYGTVQSAKEHPAVFPKKLAEMCIRLHGIGDRAILVVDPFAGSGSTGVAAVELGCDFVGFEVDAEYAEIARRKLDGEGQTSLWK
ncbi:MAG: DNA-methyltransferase [Candidatus Brocadiia bacterium]